MAIKKIILAAATACAAMGVTTLPAAAEGPVLVKQVPPEYPRGAERRSLEGTVDVAFVVDENGKVASTAVKAASIPGVFDKAATDAVEKWVFEKGSPGEGEVTIAFKLG